RGVVGKIEGREVAAGNKQLFLETGIQPDSLLEQADALQREGQTVILVAVDRKPAGLIGVADPIKPSTPEAIRQLHEQRIHILMLTGDSRSTAEAVARKLGIREFEAEVLPEKKSEAVRRLQSQGR